jgi:hypothetical protein
MAIQTRSDADPASQRTRLIVSVIPSLAGWSAVLAGGRAGSLVLAASIAAMLWVDFQAAMRRFGRDDGRCARSKTH